MKDKDPTQRHLEEQMELNKRMAGIRHKIPVLSGKGGVGKSTVATNLALALHRAGKTVGLLDTDIHGPSIPKMLNLEAHRSMQGQSGILPIEVFPGFKAMSIGFLLPTQDDAVIWRGPMKYQMIRQFLKDVDWGELDVLVIDSPPGTGDEPLTVAQSIGKSDGAVVVTTPQQVAIADVRECISFCRQLKLPVLGVLENMSGFTCPTCGTKVDIFPGGGGEAMAGELGVPFLGGIPIDPRVAVSGDAGTPFVGTCPDSPATAAFNAVVKTLLDGFGDA